MTYNLTLPLVSIRFSLKRQLHTLVQFVGGHAVDTFSIVPASMYMNARLSDEVFGLCSIEHDEGRMWFHDLLGKRSTREGSDSRDHAG